MESNDRLAALAALSVKVKGERAVLIERMRVFESKLLESVAGACLGSSVHVTLNTWEHEESGFSGGVVGRLFFNGESLTVITESYSDMGEDPKYDEYSLDNIKPDWLLRLSVPKVFDSLLENISSQLEDQHVLFSTANDWLTKFLVVEKSMIDSDLDEQFKQHPGLIDSWQKARKAVEVDPEDSIARSSSHLETVLKACLKQLGDSRYEAKPLDRLVGQANRILRDAGVIDESAVQALSGLGIIFRGVATARNASSTAHGKSDGYIAPGVELAQLINHLAGAGSAFFLRKTEIILRGRREE